MSSPLNRPREDAREQPPNAASAASPGGLTERASAPAGEPPVSLLPRPDAGLLSLATIASHYRIAADPLQLAHDLGLGARFASGEEIVRAARRIGLNSRLLKDQKVERLASVPTPAILRMKDGA